MQCLLQGCGNLENELLFNAPSATVNYVQPFTSCEEKKKLLCILPSRTEGVIEN